MSDPERKRKPSESEGDEKETSARSCPGPVTSRRMPHPSAPQFPSGKVVGGRYRFVRLLGRGGMGEGEPLLGRRLLPE